jgi:predicted hydrocarbon binding protein
VRVRDHFVLARFGKTSRERFRQEASEELRRTLSTPGDYWVDFAQFVESSELVCKLFGDGDLALAREIGRFGAETNMGIWRSLVYRVLSPQTVLGIASGLWDHHYQGGRLVTSPEGTHGVRVRIEDFPLSHRAHCLAIEGWVERTIELGRPRRVHVAERTCRLRGETACEFIAEWE